LNPRIQKFAYLVVQHLTLPFHTSHEGVLGQVIFPAAVLLVGSLHLLIKGLDIRREQSMELESRSLVIRKRRSFVEARRVEKSWTLDVGLARDPSMTEHVTAGLTSREHFKGPDIARGK
jgi:hypothetical protein